MSARAQFKARIAEDKATEKAARKSDARKVKREAQIAEKAAFVGLTPKRYKAAIASTTTTGTGTDKRKSHGAKLHQHDRYTEDGRIVKGKADVPRGTFIQYGARTKEGSLEMKQRSHDDKRKVWTQGYRIAGGAN